MNRKLLILWLPLVLTATSAVAGDFMDTRLSFTFSENNFLAGPGVTEINSPGFGIGGDEGNTLFFDNYDTRFSGFETMSHLALYKKMPSFFKHLTTEASLVVRFRIIGENDEDNLMYDAGSYIRLVYDLSHGTQEDTNLELVLFPVSGDRFRLGYSYKISWGGSKIFPLNSGWVPAAKLQLNLPWGFGFLGIKTTQILEHVGEVLQTEMVTNYGLLGGLGVDIHGFRAEVNGGAFTRGVHGHEGVRGERMLGYGVSYQIGYHLGMDIGTSIDFALYKNDPELENKFFKPEEYGEGLSLVVKHEGSFLFHTLEDSERYGTTVVQEAMAFDLNFAMKWGYFRAHMDIMYRTLSFLLFEVPSFTPYQDFPEAADVKPEYFAALGIDYHFPSLHLTPGIKIGFKMPATYTVEDLDIGGVTFGGKRTVVVSGISYRSVLPVDEQAKLLFSLKVNAKLDISESLAFIAEVYYTYDDNQVAYVSDFGGLNVVSQFFDPNVIGMNLVTQARF
jgi:hypothetical protein